MKKEHPLIRVARILDAKRPAPSGTYTLYALNKKIGLYDGRLLPENAERFATLDSQDINTGLTSRHWDQIDSSIRILRKRGIL